MTDLVALEERIAHLIRTVEDLSDVVARQDAELARLTRSVTFLAEREAEREAERLAGGSPQDERPPPHW